MGRVARLILLGCVSVCVVFCVLCCLQNNLVFSNVTILSHISKYKNYELCILAGFFVDLLRPEKKVLVICLANCSVVSVFGSGNYDRKKSSSRLSGELCCCVSFWFWWEIGSFLLWRESFITTRKKKF